MCLCEMFQRWFFTIFQRNFQISHFGSPAGRFLLIPSIFDSFLKFPYFLRSEGFSRAETGGATRALRLQLCQNLKKSLYVLWNVSPFLQNTSAQPNPNIPKIDCQKRHKLVNCLIWLEIINGKPLETILLFKMFEKIGNFAVLICCAVPVLKTSIFQSKNKTQFTVNLVQN